MYYVVALFGIALFFQIFGGLVAKCLGLVFPKLLATPAPEVPAATAPKRTVARNDGLVDSAMENIADVSQVTALAEALPEEAIAQVQRDALVTTQAREAEVARVNQQVQAVSLEPDFDYSEYRPAAREESPTPQGVLEMFDESEAESALA